MSSPFLYGNDVMKTVVFFSARRYLRVNISSRLMVEI